MNPGSQVKKLTPHYKIYFSLILNIDKLRAMIFQYTHIRYYPQVPRLAVVVDRFEPVEQYNLAEIRDVVPVPELWNHGSQPSVPT